MRSIPRSMRRCVRPPYPYMVRVSGVLMSAPSSLSARNTSMIIRPGAPLRRASVRPRAPARGPGRAELSERLTAARGR